MRDRNTAELIPELAPLLKETQTEKYAREAKQTFGAFVNGVRQIVAPK